MVVRLRRIAVILLMDAIICTPCTGSQDGFVFRDGVARATAPADSPSQGVASYASHDGWVEVTAQPATAENRSLQAADNRADEKSIDVGNSARNGRDATADERLRPIRGGDVYYGSDRGDICCSDCGDGGGCEIGCCDGDAACSQCSRLNEHDLFRCGKFFVRGWVDQGITFNAASPADRSNGPVGYNWRSNDYMMDQLYTIIGREVCANGSRWDAGGRVDVLYGMDYRYTQAIGLETHDDGTARWNAQTAAGQQGFYGLSLPQLYAEFALPLAQGTTFKVGHFYTLIGYESPMAPQNFFYSHSYAIVYGEPTTETGMLASTKLSPSLVLHGGFSRGWDMWENPYNTVSFIGKACWTSRDDRTTASFAIDTGDMEEDKNRTVLSLVISRQLGQRWTYIFQYDFGSQQDAFRNQQGQLQKADWYGVNNYLFYALSDTLSAGLRVEWFCDAQRYIVFDSEGNPALSGNDYCEITLGMNWQPNSSVIVRPELRWDWSDVKGSSQFPFRPYNDFTSSHQFLFATDIILRF